MLRASGSRELLSTMQCLIYVTQLSWAILHSNSHMTARSAPTPVASLYSVLLPRRALPVATEAAPTVTRTELTNALEQSHQPPPPATEVALAVPLTLFKTPTSRPLAVCRRKSRT